MTESEIGVVKEEDTKIEVEREREIKTEST